MASSIISAIIKGRDEFDSVTSEIERNVDAATISALRANQNKLKVAIRKNLRGAPRWTEKGANRITGGHYQVPGTTGQANRPRGGGPGRMTGVLYKGVGAAKPKKSPIDGMITGGVGIGAMPNNVKKRPLEAKFPYFRPAVEATEPLMPALYEAGWDKAINRIGGIL